MAQNGQNGHFEKYLGTSKKIKKMKDFKGKKKSKPQGKNIVGTHGKVFSSEIPMGHIYCSKFIICSKFKIFKRKAKPKDPVHRIQNVGLVTRSARLKYQ